MNQSSIIKKENGQAAVEFAILLPILLILLCGIIDFAWLAYNQLSINNACRDCARFAAVNTSEENLQDLMTQKVKNEVPESMGKTIDVQYVYSDPENPTEGTITVTCSATVKILTPLLGTITGSQTRIISADTTMKAES